MELAIFIDSLKLTAYEKEIILFLSTTDSVDAKTIYKNTHVPQGRIYSVLQELSNKGIITIVPLKPKKYQIKNIKQSLKDFIDNKQTELKQKYSQIDELILKPKNIREEQKTPTVSFFSGREEHINEVVKIRNRAKKELLQIGPSFAGNFSSRLSLQKALQRGVSVKLLIYAITKDNILNIKNCIKYGGEVRILKTYDSMPLLIRDSEELLIGVQKYENKEERLIVSSENTALIKALKEYFLTSWNSATKVNKIQLRKT